MLVVLPQGLVGDTRFAYVLLSRSQQALKNEALVIEVDVDGPVKDPCIPESKEQQSAPYCRNERDERIDAGEYGGRCIPPDKSFFSLPTPREDGDFFMPLSAPTRFFSRRLKKQDFHFNTIKMHFQLTRRFFLLRAFP